MSNALGTDMIIEILLRLPAISLLRFKCVCKLWYDLITDLEFGRLHLERSLANKTNLHFVLEPPNRRIFEFDCLEKPTEFNCPAYCLADFDTLDNLVELNHPYRDEFRALMVVGSCHGLLCICNLDGENDLLLYNPTTQTHRMLPYLPIIEPFHRNVNCEYGFGYDSFSKDYKCVRILQHLVDKDSRAFNSSVMVYSLRSDSWRRAPDVPHYFDHFNGSSALVNESVHWVDSHKPQAIIAFSLADETFSSLLLPKLDMISCFKGFHRLFVGVLDGCLCVSANYYSVCDLWVMKEYGNVESWTLMFSFAQDCYDDVTRPVCLSVSGKGLFVAKSHLIVEYLDLETMKMTNLKPGHFDIFLDAHICVENLIMLNYVDHYPVEVKHHSRKRRRRSRRRRYKRSRERTVRSTMVVHC